MSIAACDETTDRNRRGSAASFKDSGSNDPPNSPHQKARAQLSSLLVGVVLSVGVLFCSPGCVPPANAGFGPSSGATTSPPPGLATPNVKSQDLIGGTTANKKLKIRIGSSLDDRRLQEFSQQLDDIIEELKDRQAMAGTEFETEQQPSADAAADASKDVDDSAPFLSIGGSSADSLEELEKAQLLRKQISDRERLLEKLEAQPYWFNYLAAFIGSLASTLVMHPVDTFKTRRQLASSSDAAAAAAAAATALDGGGNEKRNA